MTGASPAPAAWQPADGLSGRFEGRAAFEAQVLHFLEQAAAQGWPQLIVADLDFADWPWGSAAAVELLHQWARQGRQMTVLAYRFDNLAQRQPRLLQWRKTWDHRLQCRQMLSRDASQIPSALWSPQWAVQRLDAARCVGVASAERRAIVPLGEQLQEWTRSASTPAFPATVLGL
jgi:hypothetical protein